MFKGLHQMLGNTTQQESTKQPHAIPVETAASLLAIPRRQDYLKNIKSLLHLPPKLYDTLYYRVIERFAEFVQTIPETQHGAFASSAGFLEHGLERASRALTLCLSYFFPAEKSFRSVNSEQALWIYAVFTAGLLLDVGKLATKYQINLCNKDGTTVKEWLPYSGSMVGQAKYYKYSYVKQNRDHLRRLITSILARQLLTEADTAGDGTTVGGFNWIASNPEVLEAWLNMLYGDTRNITAYLTVLPYADLLAIENNLANERANLGKNALFSTDLFDTETNNLAALAAGLAFHEWLRANIANGNLSINEENSLINRVEDGLIIATPELINQFLKNNPQFQDPQIIKTQFTQLAELYNVSVGELGNTYAGLPGSIAAVYLKNWRAAHQPNLYIGKPEFLLALDAAKNTPINPNINIIKTPEQTITPANNQQQTATVQSPQQQANVKLQPW